MTLYQKIPTTTARVHPLMLVAAAGIVLLSIATTAAIVGWLPAAGAGDPSVSSPVPATAARASSASATAGAPVPVRKARQQNSQAGATQFASA